MARLSREVEIRNPKGLHARAAAKFVKTAEAFEAQICVIKDDMSCGGTSILCLMMLAAGIGCEIALTAEGPDAEAALAAVAKLVESGFGEVWWSVSGVLRPRWRFVALVGRRPTAGARRSGSSGAGSRDG